MMKSLLYSIFAASVIVINGCANIVKNKKPDDAVSTATSKGLPAQELASGECGVFLWDNAVPRSFIFFQKPSEKSRPGLLENRHSSTPKTKWGVWPPPLIRCLRSWQNCIRDSNSGLASAPNNCLRQTANWKRRGPLLKHPQSRRVNFWPI